MHLAKHLFFFYYTPSIAYEVCRGVYSFRLSVHPPGVNILREVFLYIKKWYFSFFSKLPFLSNLFFFLLLLLTFLLIPAFSSLFFLKSQPTCARAVRIEGSVYNVDVISGMLFSHFQEHYRSSNHFTQMLAYFNTVDFRIWKEMRQHATGKISFFSSQEPKALRGSLYDRQLSIIAV